MQDRRTILITGAAGNLGSFLSRQLMTTGHQLRLMYHRTPLPEDVVHGANVRPIKADLRDPATLPPAVTGVDVIVHFAGRLFAPRPERFLPETNTGWFSNLVTSALQSQVGRIILISFPHVEGPTSVTQPATGRLDRQPISVHARTRLEEERLLFERTEDTGTSPVVLRLGTIYGRGILMIEAARWLARRRLLCVWREPTLLQLLCCSEVIMSPRERNRNVPLSWWPLGRLPIGKDSDECEGIITGGGAGTGEGGRVECEISGGLAARRVPPGEAIGAAVSGAGRQRITARQCGTTVESRASDGGARPDPRVDPAEV